MNLILISLDTLRADRLGCYGYPRATSPELDLLSRGAVLFGDVIAQSTITPASHRSIFTGRYLRKEISGHAPGDPALAEVLRERGWRTAAFVDGGLMKASFGNARGFETYDDRYTGFAGIMDKGLGWLAAHGAERFFLFLHTFDIHCPYDPAPPYGRMFRAAEGPDIAGKCEVLLHKLGLDEAGYDYVSDSYDGGIRQADAQLQRLWRALEERDLLGCTIIVVFSDHGESLGERGMLGHGSLFEEQLHVPLILRVPGGKGRVVAQPIQMIDLLPTLLSLLGAPAPSGLDGRDLTPFLRGGTPAGAPPVRVSEMAQPAVLRNDGWKLILGRRPGLDKLFHLPEDPLEKENLIHRNPEIVRELIRACEQTTGLDEEQAREAARQTREWVRLRQVVPRGPDEEPAPDPDEELLEELRMLGYVE
jgi:arylsulfatase A-like enzyme